MQNVFRAAMDDGVAGVVPALAAHDDVGLRGQDIDDLAFAFIAPLRADQNRVRHCSQGIGNKPCGCKQFRKDATDGEKGLSHGCHAE